MYSKVQYSTLHENITAINDIYANCGRVNGRVGVTCIYMRTCLLQLLRVLGRGGTIDHTGAVCRLARCIPGQLERAQQDPTGSADV